MSEHDDPLVEALRQKQRGHETAEERYRQEERTRRQLVEQHAAAFAELAGIPRERLAAAAQKAGMKFTVDEHGDTVMLRLGPSTSLQFRMQNLGQPSMDLPGGEVLGAAYFGEASTSKDRASLNSCNFLRFRRQGDDEAYWRGCRFRISGAVPGERVAQRLRLEVVPTIDDTFGISDTVTLRENGSKAARMMHVVTVDFTDDVRAWFEEIIAKALR